MFLSSFENKLDKKGRVSVPSTFRSHLNSMGYNGFITYPSFNHSALEACSQDRIEKLSKTIDSLNPFDEKRDYFATSILSERLILLTDVKGVLDKKGNLLTEISINDVKKLIENGTINGGMIPKVETCVDAVKNGVNAAVILDGRLPHSILLEIFTEHGVGTLISN